MGNDSLMLSPDHEANRSEEDRSRVVAALARDLNASVDEVDGVFAEQLAGLSSQARIHHFLVTLAVRNTRMVLRQRHGRDRYPGVEGKSDAHH
jgi:hypothetical protein